MKILELLRAQLLELDTKREATIAEMDAIAELATTESRSALSADEDTAFAAAELLVRGAADAPGLLDPAFLAAEIDTLGAGTMAELLKLFSDDLPAAFDELETACRAHDWAALGKRAHRLRSAASNLGMSKVMATSRAIETAAGDEAVASETMAAALEQLMEDCLASCDALQAQLADDVGA